MSADRESALYFGNQLMLAALLSRQMTRAPRKAATV
jgi:hypothetical protein